MPISRIEIDGEVYGWDAARAAGAARRRLGEDVFWLKGRDRCCRVEIGRLKPWSGGAGWTVHPRLGGNLRACRASMGYARTRESGIRQLIQLARSEECLTVLDKVELHIVRDGPEGTIIDSSQGLVPLPKAV
ncbi:hypothetical protein [Methylorubrum extorquens]|uniref:Uncharacterized protein n=1 Tax=Methylorubrum extorquens DSM 13060 TaxID=882800 RepID=H1KCN7_METEX|nr:hypothetical protein [Methylorubrum extorquens]EHP94710.1 hypothetical protein MetexDRAFT_0399 [Methylorubrum extorquens DSM 13060]